MLFEMWCNSKAGCVGQASAVDAAVHLTCVCSDHALGLDCFICVVRVPLYSMPKHDMRMTRVQALRILQGP
jgi:hypothetical protein